MTALAPSRAAATAGPRATFPWRDLAARCMRVVWLWSALLTLLAGCYAVTRAVLWRDELASWSYASRPVPELIAIMHHRDASQLGYYLLLHYWIAAFGESVQAMRMLSVLAMAGAAACLTLGGRRLADERAGLLAGLVFALVPSVSRFAQEIRFYGLEVLVATLAGPAASAAPPGCGSSASGTPRTRTGTSLRHRPRRCARATESSW